MALQMVNGEWFMVKDYLPFVVGLVLICGVSFWDDVKSLPDSVRLMAQFVAMALMFWSMFGFQNSGFMVLDWYWRVAVIIVALIVCVGASNIINFMDGINGITGAYAMASLIPLYILNNGVNGGFVDNSFIITMMLADVVFCYFNFRPRGKAKCFAGDVGSLGVAFLLLFLIGCKVMQTGDITYLVFLVVYGVDGVLTICHRIMLHENLGQAHRKHAFQLMANELKMSHITVSLIYACLQLAISLGFIYLVPNNILAHWTYLLSSIVVLSVAYVLFKKKYYHLHEEYLRGLEPK
jgi:UDP-N-acetylmuramyl pentapeptide phosphotransferase/UDP-N-acetylglucosamine-1-phosphate transferase